MPYVPLSPLRWFPTKSFWICVALTALLVLPIGCGDDDKSTDAGIVVSVAPATATVEVNQTQQFTATVTGTTNQNVTWSVDGGAVNGTVNATGLYTAPATVPNPATVMVRATSVVDPGKSGTATMTVTPVPPVSVSVAPPTASVQVDQTQQFTATVTGTANTAVTWSVEGGLVNGTIDASGLFQAPATVPSPATVRVRAMLVADATNSGTASVMIVPVAGFVRIEPGMFLMGSPASEPDRYSDETQHWVQITKPFLLGEVEVTQAQWQAVMGTSPSDFLGPQRPVEQVTWFDAVAYCNALTDREAGLTRAYTINGSTVTWNPAANGYRLPTESEWEYACRAGTTTRYWSGETESDLARAAWYSGNSGNQTHDVKGKQANRWGLCDTLGNVWEWCWDWYDTYPAGAQGDPAGDPAGPASKTYRVLRGGSWYYNTNDLRCANRSYYPPTSSDSSLGFRVARTVNP